MAIDVHTHAEEPCGLHGDDSYDDFQAQMRPISNRRTSILRRLKKTAAYDRTKKIAAMTGFRQARIRDEIRPKVLKENALKLLRL